MHVLLVETSLVLLTQFSIHCPEISIITTVAIFLGSMFWNLGSKTKDQTRYFDTSISFVFCFLKHEIFPSLIVLKSNKIFSIPWATCMLLFSLILRILMQWRLHLPQSYFPNFQTLKFRWRKLTQRNQFFFLKKTWDQIDCVYKSLY